MLGDLWMVHSVCIGYVEPNFELSQATVNKPDNAGNTNNVNKNNTNDFRGDETSHEQYRIRFALNTRTWLWQNFGYFANDNCHIRNAFGEVTIMNARANTNGGGVVVPGRASGPCHYSKRTDDDDSR